MNYYNVYTKHIVDVVKEDLKTIAIEVWPNSKISKLGEGCFSSVFLVENDDDNFVIKLIPDVYFVVKSACVLKYKEWYISIMPFAHKIDITLENSYDLFKRIRNMEIVHGDLHNDNLMEIDSEEVKSLHSTAGMDVLFFNAEKQFIDSEIGGAVGSEKHIVNFYTNYCGLLRWSPIDDFVGLFNTFLKTNGVSIIANYQYIEYGLSPELLICGFCKLNDGRTNIAKYVR